jgi:DNA-binding LytR/AlgR family response regulator
MDRFNGENYTSTDKVLMVKDGYTPVKVDLEAVRYICSDQNYAVFYLTNGKRLMVRSTLIEMIEKLPARLFLRVNRGTIINVNHVTALQTNELYIGDVQFNIRRTVREAAHQHLAAHS